MDWLQSIIIAIVEGLTEFLPVSSTGHMIITENMLGVDITDKFVNAFTVIIQFGAILSVVCLYWRRFFVLKKAEPGATGMKAFLQKYDFYWKLLVAFIPAAVIGLALGDFIESLMGNVWVVAIMLVAVRRQVVRSQGGQTAHRAPCLHHRSVSMHFDDSRHLTLVCHYCWWYAAGTYSQNSCRVLVLPCSAHYGSCHWL